MCGGLSSGQDNISDAESKRLSNLPLPSPPRCSSRTPQPERFRITWRALPGKRRRLYRCSTTSQALRPKRADRQRPCSTHPKPSKPPQPICAPRSKVSWKRRPSDGAKPVAGDADARDFAGCASQQWSHPASGPAARRARLALVGCGQHDERSRIAAFQLSPCHRKHNLADQLHVRPGSDRNEIA